MEQAYRQRDPDREEQIRKKKVLRKKRKRRAKLRFLAKLFFLLMSCCVLFFLADILWKMTVGEICEKKEMNPERLAEEGYPESLIKLLEKNPETEQFVLDYFKNKDKHPEIDVSKEISRGEIPLFLQWDERWGYETYGDNLLALTGCGPTCLSMVACGLSGEAVWDPYQVACMAEEQGYYVPGTGSSWELMTSGAEELGLSAWEVIFDEDHIRSTLQAGNPIICVVGPGDFTDNGHFLVLAGMDAEGKILVKDPNSRLRSRETWELQALMEQTKNMWAYSY